jgi:hypothetical protein
MEVASWISDPSNTPLPLRTTPAVAMEVSCSDQSIIGGGVAILKW